MIDVPATAMAALRAGVPPIVLFKAVLGGTTYRFAKSPRDVQYDGATWEAGTPLARIDNVGSAPQNGTLALTLNDPARTWITRFELLGERGKEIEVHSVIPHGANLLWPDSVFIGKSVRASTVRPTSENNDYRCVVECADEAAFNNDEEPEFASDAHQRMLAKALGLVDDSHVIANKSRRLVWHRT